MQPPEYLPFASPDIRRIYGEAQNQRVRNHHVVIVGAGFAGIAVAVELKRRGITDFVILERADDVGGVWRDNTYPGCRCDIPSLLYSYSFAPKPDWEDHFATQPEIWRYLRDVTTAFELEPHIRYKTDVEACSWNKAQGHWFIETSDGRLTARLLVTATGALNEPAYPGIADIESFSGTAFHSSEWPLDFDPSRRRIAVIGTGASAIQLVPEIVEASDETIVFQRTAPWVLPRNDHSVGSRQRILRNLPFATQVERGWQIARREVLSSFFAGSSRAMALVERAGRRHLEEQVPDPDLRARLVPNYRAGCKRVLMSDDWYPALQKPNTSLVTDEITGLSAGGVQTRDSNGRTQLHQVDTVIFATGFTVTRLPFLFKIFDADGRSLARRWAVTGPSAYLGTTVHGFPNLALMTGPNTGLATNSMVIMIEAQARYIGQMAERLRDNPERNLDVREEVQQNFTNHLEQRLEKSIWSTGGCNSWYQDARGKVTALWPGTTTEFRLRTRTLKLDDYQSQ